MQNADWEKIESIRHMDGCTAVALYDPYPEHTFWIFKFIVRGHLYEEMAPTISEVIQKTYEKYTQKMDAR